MAKNPMPEGVEKKDPCPQCDSEVEYIETDEDLSGDEWHRFKCDCGYKTVRILA